MQVNKKIIFLNSCLPRTGHNFASDVIKIFSNHQVLINPRSETKISTFLDSYYTIRENEILNKTNRKFFDYLFINDLREKILLESDHDFVMIKDTTFCGIDKISKVFPDDIQIILLRDPSRIILSLLKAMNLKKKNFKTRLKKILMPLGIFPFLYSRKLSKQVLHHISGTELENKFIIRYEDLFLKDEETLLQLKELFNSNKELAQIKNEIDDIRVINSSFFEETGGNRIWDSKPKTQNFAPLQRRNKNLLIQKAVEIGSAKLRKKLNYK